MWEEILKFFGGTAMLVAAVAWLARSVIVHYLDKDVETFKVQLQREAFEHEVRFRRVDQKVAEHLSELYARLFSFYEAVHSYVKILEWGHEPPKDEKLKAVNAASREFYDYLLPNRLYVPPRLYKRVRAVAGKLTDIANDFTRGLKREERGVYEQDEDYWMKAFDAVKNEADPVFSEIVAAFQKRLGVQDEE